ncbi:MAG: hypothetical protein ACLFVE_15070 [Chitinispirillaceae bacterium]
MFSRIRFCKLFVPFLLLLCLCVEEKEEVIRQKLDVVLEDDLRAIVEGVTKKGLIEDPYFKIVEYESYEEGYYSRKAVVDFYFLKTVKRKIRRKYRYQNRLGLWDRYFNEYMPIVPQKDESKN